VRKLAQVFDSDQLTFRPKTNEIGCKLCRNKSSYSRAEPYAGCVGAMLINNHIRVRKKIRQTDRPTPDCCCVVHYALRYRRGQI